MRSKILYVLLLIMSLTACADSKTSESIKQSLVKLMPDIKIESITPTVIPGLFEVSSGTNVLYVSADGNYLVQGELYNIKDSKDVVNLTAQTRKIAVEKLITTIDPATMIIYKAPHEKTYISVLTDIDCGYCRALQKDVAELNAAGITVRYLAFPRADKGTKSYDKAISVWCSPDRNLAYSDAMNGKDPSPLACANQPVDAHKKFGEQIGVTGTPSIIFKNGFVAPGYLPPKEMIEAVNKYGK